MPFKKKTAQREFHNYTLFHQHGIACPQVLQYDAESGILTLEDVHATHRSCEISSADFSAVMQAVADLHSMFWDNYAVFGQVGLPWEYDNKENFVLHCKAIMKMSKQYSKAHKIKNERFLPALQWFCNAMPAVLADRHWTGKNISVIHGDLHPGNVMLPVAAQGQVLFVDLEAVRIGLPAYDLAQMLLHLPPEQTSLHLKHYYNRLCTQVNGYTYETLLADYKLALSQCIFFIQKLYFNGIDDPQFMQKALDAWDYQSRL